MYLVSECTTKSAPSSRGRVAIGVAKVESTASNAAPSWAMRAAAAMSLSRTMGLAGVSSHTSLVDGRMAAEILAGSEVSTGVTSIPMRGSVVRASSAVPA